MGAPAHLVPKKTVMAEELERVARWAGFYTDPTPPQAQRQTLHRQRLSCTFLMNGNIAGNDMGCAADSLSAAVALPGLCHARSLTIVSFECWDERCHDFRDERASAWAADTK